MKRYFKKIDKVIMVASIFLFTFGLFMILSASNMEAIVRYEYTPYHYFIRQLIFIAVGTVIFGVIIRVKTINYRKLAPIFTLVIFSILIFLYPYGIISHSSKSWFPILGFRIQPSEFIKPLLILSLAIYYESIKNKFDNFKLVFLFPFLFVSVLFLLVFFQPDLGTASIILFLFLLIFTTIKTPKEVKQKIIIIFASLIVIGGGAVLLFGKSLISGEQIERLNFGSPCDRYMTSGYQVCNGFIAISNGGLLGAGLGNSTQKYLYLPDAHNDFIFAIVMEETGLLFSIFIILVYLVLLLKILRIGNKSLQIRGRIISYGVFFYILLHIIINLFGLYGLAPYTGVPLPFLSYGGSFTTNLFIALALVVRVDIENKEATAKKIK